MKNTFVYLWLQPTFLEHEICNKKVFFNCVINGDHTHITKKELEILLGDMQTIRDIMNFADIYVNNDFGVVKFYKTSLSPYIEFTDSPKELKVKKAVASVINGDKEVTLTDDNVVIEDESMIKISLPALGVKQKIDFATLWAQLELNVQGKIKEGQRVELVDDEGNVIFDLVGGSFLAIGNGDMTVWDKKTGNRKGGLYIREDGSIDIGDENRTFWLKVYTDKLVRAAIKTNKSLQDILKPKLLK